jgi:hypothetical protein
MCYIYYKLFFNNAVNQIYANKKALKLKSSKAYSLNGAPYRIRTCDQLIRSQLLYPAELRAHIIYLIIFDI